MTEQVTERAGAEALEERPRCWEGSKTDRPCWREAVERAYANDDEPTICAEHSRAYALAIEESELHCQLDALGAWIATWDDPSTDENRLRYYSFTARQQMVEELWSLSIRAKAAEIIADQGPDEEPLTQEQAERLAEYGLRSDALLDTGQLFQDLQAVPEWAFGRLSRWQTAAAIMAAGREASVEQMQYRRELRQR